MLERILETEVMDTLEEATDYNAMDHREVNRRFVTDLLATDLDRLTAFNESRNELLDLGTGTALIPIELVQRHPEVRVVAVDASVNMLELARYNLEVEGVTGRVFLDRIDAKELPFPDGRFAGVISNSIIHHIPEPASVLAEAVRVTAPGGLLFIRDLARPDDEETLAHLVQTYTGEENEHCRQMFADSLHAALTLDEIRALIEPLGFDPQTVQLTTDRHWTWIAVKPEPGDSAGQTASD